MTKKFICRSNSIYSLDEVIEVSKKLANTYQITDGFKPYNPNFYGIYNIMELPDLSDLDGVKIDEVDLTGYLPVNGFPLNEYLAVIELSKINTDEIGQISVSCGFEEKASKQNKDYFDSVSIVYYQNKKYFNYSANGSLVSKDKQYRRNIFDLLIGTLMLPLEIHVQDRKNDFLDLVHSDGGDLQIHDINPRHLPNGFSCELPNLEDNDLLKLLNDALNLLSNGTVFTYDWDITIKPSADKRINLNVTDELPADSYDINIEYSVEGINGLDYLGTWCEHGDKSKSRLCGFDIANGVGAELYAVTSMSGHELVLVLSKSEKLDELEQLLGIKFNPTQHIK